MKCVRPRVGWWGGCWRVSRVKKSELWGILISTRDPPEASHSGNAPLYALHNVSPMYALHYAQVYALHDIAAVCIAQCFRCMHCTILSTSPPDMQQHSFLFKCKVMWIWQGFMSSASKANVQKFRIIRKAVACVGKLHNKNLLEKRFQDEASMVLKESMYTAQCIAKKGREGEGGSEGC